MNNQPALLPLLVCIKDFLPVECQIYITIIRIEAVYVQWRRQKNYSKIIQAVELAKLAQMGTAAIMEPLFSAKQKATCPAFRNANGKFKKREQPNAF
jgi:hypothetical protein